MLQSLLQPRENQRSKMIGAMPAVAVRHERRRNDKRGGGGGRRPSQLPLQLARPAEDATPSPPHHRLQADLYVCGKVALLHGIVGAVLLGIVVLVVGLVQLSPGAEAAQHRYYLMGAGAALTAGGLIAAVLRCICLHWFNRKYGGDPEAPASAASAAGAAGAHAHKAPTPAAAPATAPAPHKHKLKAQASVTTAAPAAAAHLTTAAPAAAAHLTTAAHG